MNKITKKEAQEILKRIHLPVSSSRTTILAADTKAARQDILSKSGHEDREMAAAIEIQRVWRGYLLRCRLYDALYLGASLETEVQSSQRRRWADSSLSLDDLVPQVPSDTVSSEQFHTGVIEKSSSRLKLEEAYQKWLLNNSPISFEDYCALVIQSWWHQVSEEQRILRVPSVRPPTMNDSYSSDRLSQFTTYEDSGPTIAVPAVLTRKAAARIIQRAWRRHIDMQVYRYYRDLISFKFRGDPALLLRCINPREAELLDSASGTHVKFRLAGTKFPPNIYYKIFTHRPVIDLCANSPKDYTKPAAKQLVAGQRHNKHQAISGEGDREGWYERWENNGWRLVSDRILRKIDEDALAYDSSQTKTEFKHSRILRKQDIDRKRKMKKIKWMKKLYHEGMLWTKQGTESPVQRDIENTVKGMVEITDKLGHSAVEEWEVDELLEWTNGLNFDRYVSDWKEYATSATSDQIAERTRFINEDWTQVALTR